MLKIRNVLFLIFIGGAVVKKIEIIILRHGESIWNRMRVHQGQSWCDPGLTDAGMKQMECTAEYLSKERVIAVWSSPLPRARQSAAIIHKAHADHRHTIPLIHDYALMEITQGIADCVPFEDIKEKHPISWKRWKQRIIHEPIFPGAESIVSAAERTMAVHKKIGKRSGKFKQNENLVDGKVVVVSHGAVNSFLFAKIAEKPLNTALEEFWQDNACINRIMWDTETGEFEIISINETHHLGALHTPTKKEV